MQKSIFIFLFAISIGPSVLGQFEKLDSIRRDFSAFREAALQEKLYVHTGQEFYMTGETLWFKVYSVDGTLHRPVNISKVAYVELLDVNGKSVIQGKVSLDKTGGQGSFFIPATLLTGNYQMRAYTQWMKNFSPVYFFRKNITIVNPFVTPERAKQVNPKVDIEFFPEGGNLVKGVRSKVAFKVSSTVDGSNFKGFVTRSSGDTVATFSPLKFGLGHFYITPDDTEKYTCTIYDSQGNKSVTALPKVQPFGYAMQVIDSADNKIYVKVTMKGEGTRFAYLFVHARQMVVHAEVKQGVPDLAWFAIDRSKLPEGVSHFTIFNADETPMCERLYFVRPATQLDVKVNVSQPTLLPRSKVSLDVNAMVQASTVPANLSVSVYRIDSLAKTPVKTIWPYLVLTSDLSGEVESPEYYLSNDPAVEVATDNLMLTHGWRRFDWEQVLKKNYRFNFIPELRSHIVKGRVSDQSGNPVNNVLAYISSPSKLVQLNAAKSDSRGELSFEMNDFWGQRKIIAQLNSEVDSLLTIKIEDPFSKDVTQVAIPDLRLSPVVEGDLKLRSLAMQVQDIYYRELGDRIVNKPKNDSTSFFGKADKTYLLDDYTRFPLLEEVMREYVPDVFVRKRKDGFHFLMVNTLWNKMFEAPPFVMLDGVPVFDLDKMMRFDPRMIKRLEVIPRYFYLGPLRIHGVVSFATYQGNLQGFELDPRAVVLDYEGLQLHREFYAPKYETGKQRNSKLPDQRTALYWEPMVLTDGKGNKTLEFFTSDVSGNYLVVVEGVTAEGKAGTGTATFQVNNQEF